jgi:hypothetical protein
VNPKQAAKAGLIGSGSKGLEDIMKEQGTTQKGFAKKK